METQDAPCHACGKYKYLIFLLFLVLLFSSLFGFKYLFSITTHNSGVRYERGAHIPGEDTTLEMLFS